MPRFLNGEERYGYVSNEDNNPIRVTAEEHRHPALRILARACIAIARDQVEREEKKDELAPAEAPRPKPDETEEDAV